MIVSNVPQAVKWRIYRGDTASFSILVNDEDGLPQDMTDWEFVAEVKESPTDDVALTSLTVVGGIGVATVTLPPANALLLQDANVYDIQATKPNGEVWTLLRGSIVVEGDVSR